MLRWLAVVLLLATACKKEDRCARLMPRLMPNPSAQDLETCRLQAEEPEISSAIDCLLAVPGPISDSERASCPGSERMLYFHF